MISLVRRWFYHESAIRGWDEICEHLESQSCESSETMQPDGGDFSDPINDYSNTVEPDAIDSATSIKVTVSPLAPKSTNPALPDCDINNKDDDDDDDKHTIIRYKCLTFIIAGRKIFNRIFETFYFITQIRGKINYKHPFWASSH